MKKILILTITANLWFENLLPAIKIDLSIKEIIDSGYKLTHITNEGRSSSSKTVLIFENGKSIYLCDFYTSEDIRCYDLTN